MARVLADLHNRIDWIYSAAHTWEEGGGEPEPEPVPVRPCVHTAPQLFWSPIPDHVVVVATVTYLIGWHGMVYGVVTGKV